jgi:hypothetical protein
MRLLCPCFELGDASGVEARPYPVPVALAAHAPAALARKHGERERSGQEREWTEARRGGPLAFAERSTLAISNHFRPYPTKSNLWGAVSGQWMVVGGERAWRNAPRSNHPIKANQTKSNRVRNHGLAGARPSREVKASQTQSNLRDGGSGHWLVVSGQRSIAAMHPSQSQSNPVKPVKPV